MSYNTLTDTSLPQATPQEQTTSQAALDTAQTYLDALYGQRYLGVLESDDITVQPDLWPRTASDGTALTDGNGREISGIPAVLLRAEVVAAELSLSGSALLPTEVATATSASTQNSQLIENTVQAGNVKSTKRWSPSSTTTTTGASTQTLSDAGLPIIAAIEAIISSILQSSNSSNYYFNRA